MSFHLLATPLVQWGRLFKGLLSDGSPSGEPMTTEQRLLRLERSAAYWRTFALALVALAGLRLTLGGTGTPPEVVYGRGFVLVDKDGKNYGGLQVLDGHPA